MPRQNSDDSSQAIQRQQALSRWDNEGGAADPTVTPVADKKQIPTPEMSNADLVVLHVRVIALENLFAASNRMLSLPLQALSIRSYRSGLFCVRQSPASRATRIGNGATSGVAVWTVNGACRSTSSKPGMTTSRTLPRQICLWTSFRVRERGRSNKCKRATANAARSVGSWSMPANISSPFLASSQTWSKALAGG